MEQTELIRNYKGKATYQIMVHGKVEPGFLQRLNYLTVSHTEADGQIYSTLMGEIKDQGALSGIINILIDHQYDVISVMKIGL